MAKRIKKPPVRPEQRRDWLHRFEVEGETQFHLAKEEKYDIRTIRRQIELAKEEREVKEARGVVLRNALEKHYDDLTKFAERLEMMIQEVPNVALAPDDDFFKEALRQHLPRSPLWTYLSKWDDSLKTFEDNKKLLYRYIEMTLNSDRNLKKMKDAGLEGVLTGVMELLVSEVEKHWLCDNVGFTLKNELILEPAENGKVNPRFGFSHVGVITRDLAEKYMPQVRNVIGDLENKIKVSEEYLSLEKTNSEIARLKEKLREELAMIRLKRIIPGRCKYCPL